MIFKFTRDGLATGNCHSNNRPDEQSKPGRFSRLSWPVFARGDQGMSPVHTPNNMKPKSKRSKKAEAVANATQEVLANLRKQMRDMQFALQWMSISSSPFRQRRPTSSREQRNYTHICWFHHKFSNEAKNCRPPC